MRRMATAPSIRQVRAITFTRGRDASSDDVDDVFKLKADGEDGIAFDRDGSDHGNEDVFKMRADGSNERKLMGTRGAVEYSPSWQPKKC